MNRIFPLLVLSLAALAPATAKTAQPPVELLFVGPLDTTLVTVDSTLDLSVLASAKTLRKGPSDAALIARAFYPRFGEAVSLAARKVEVIDSSGGSPLAPGEEVPRYTLRMERLVFSQDTRSVARHFVEPTPPAFDPATGTMNPGNRKGYSEGPGRVTTLTARAQWILWDNTRKNAFAKGTASGESSWRGDAGKAQWDEAARELAKAVLKQTAFTPY